MQHDSSFFAWAAGIAAGFSILDWLIAILVFLIGTTLLIHRLFGVEHFFVGWLWKTEAFNPVFDRFTFLGRALDIMADLGLVLGFGVPAADRLYGRTRPKPRRIAISLATAAILGAPLFFLLLPNAPVTTSSVTLSFEFALLIVILTALLGFLGFMVSSLAAAGFDILQRLFTNEIACPQVTPIIPGLEIPGSPIFIPLFVWLVLLIVIVVHEGFHGILMRRFKMKVKSSGLVFLGLIPGGAFVEPDEKELSSAEERKQLRVYSAGPTSNLALTLLIWLLLIPYAMFVQIPALGALGGVQEELVEGVRVQSVDENIVYCNYRAKASAFGEVEPGWLIAGINGVEVSSTAALMEEFLKDADPAAGVFPENVTFTFQDSEGTSFDKTLARDPRIGTTGIRVESIFKDDPKLIEERDNLIFLAVADLQSPTLPNFLFWLLFISLALGMFNFLPLALTDGGRMAPFIFSPILERFHIPRKQAVTWLTYFFLIGILLLIVLNALPYFFSVQ